MGMQGIQGNAWNAVLVGAGDLSPSIDMLDAAFIQVMGTTSGASTITVSTSADGVTFYALATIAASGVFNVDYTISCRWVQLKSSAAVTITATVVGK